MFAVVICRCAPILPASCYSAGCYYARLPSNTLPGSSPRHWKYHWAAFRQFCDGCKKSTGSSFIPYLTSCRQHFSIFALSSKHLRCYYLTGAAGDAMNPGLLMTAFMIRAMQFGFFTSFFAMRSINDCTASDRQIFTSSRLVVTVLSPSLVIWSFTWNGTPVIALRN